MHIVHRRSVDGGRSWGEWKRMDTAASPCSMAVLELADYRDDDVPTHRDSAMTHECGHCGSLNFDEELVGQKKQDPVVERAVRRVGERTGECPRASIGVLVRANKVIASRQPSVGMP